MNSIDYSFHQSSLNNFTAVPDRDGVVRFVLTRNDPGVANWIDTAGYEHGYVLGRYYGCKTTPVPTVKKIQVADLRKSLPAGVKFVTAEQREQSLRARAIGSQLRRRW